MAKPARKSKSDLGRALIKDRSNKTRNRRRVEDNSMLHSTEVNDGYDWGRLNLQSVTAESSLQEFLSTAELAEREFAAEKLNIKFVSSAPTEVQISTSQPSFDEPLTVPRRPGWIQGVSAEEQLAREKQDFLEWRKTLNELQQSLGAWLTPYERNIELWRQLWRTLEKSDVVLILLDSRNPLLFRCEDLEKYAQEQNCKFVLLLNKADLITKDQRKAWASYFSDKQIPALFFSAKNSNEKHILDDITEEVEKLNVPEELNDSDDSSENEAIFAEQLKTTEEDIKMFKERLEKLNEAVSNTATKYSKISDNLNRLKECFYNGTPIEDVCTSNASVYTPSKDPYLDPQFEIYDRSKLIDYLVNIRLKRKDSTKLVIGMIGYPNVGKSSTVNVLMKNKKVSVSSMPGHTRYIQSLKLTGDVEILDCPGLVLPAYAVTPDLLLTAVLPIDQMRSHDAAMARLCELVPRSVFVKKYGLLLPDEGKPEDTYKQILTSHAYNRGFMTAAGQPDKSRSARLILKEAASGALQWCVMPPGTESKPSKDDVEAETIEIKRKPTPMEKRMVEGWTAKSSEIDNTFFGSGISTAHVKGKKLISSMPGPLTSQQDMDVKTRKAFKKHANKNKREKLRRVYAHLDEH